MMAKTYPFSARKHTHDIEFRRNYVFNLMHEGWTGYDKLYKQLTELVSAMCGGAPVVYLTGKQIQLAKESVAWAAIQRGA